MKGLIERLRRWWTRTSQPKPERILVDREGVAYPPVTEVKLRAPQAWRGRASPKA